MFYKNVLIICTRSSWEKKPPPTGVDLGKLNERTHCLSCGGPNFRGGGRGTIIFCMPDRRCLGNNNYMHYFIKLRKQWKHLVSLLPPLILFKIEWLPRCKFAATVPSPTLYTL